MYLCARGVFIMLSHQLATSCLADSQCLYLSSSPAARKPDISPMYVHELLKLVSIHPGMMTSTDHT